MSWFVTVVPLHFFAADPGRWDWLRSDPTFIGVPADPPAPRPLPAMRDVLGALERSGCHGDPWYTVTDPEAGPRLPPCPRGDACDFEKDLGEVLIHGGGGDHLSLDTPVDDMAFRSPAEPAAVLGALAFAEVAGPVVAIYDTNMALAVINPGDDPAAITAVWPYQ
jgi:hypothetical protein